MKVIKVSEILKKLEADGWYLVNYEGSHRQFKHPTKKGKVTVMVVLPMMFGDFF